MSVSNATKDQGRDFPLENKSVPRWIQNVLNARSNISDSTPYLLAIGTTATASVIRQFGFELGFNLPWFATFVPAVVVTALFTGWRGGLAAIAACIGVMFLSGPGYAPLVPSNALFFLLVSLFLVWVCDQFRTTIQVMRDREDAHGLMVQELNHRVKNTLATVQSMARMTLRSSPNMEAFGQSFEARLLALSKTHNLLTQSGWAGASIRALAESEIAPYAATRSGRVRIEGDELHVNSRTALALGMIFHELTTNAIKHGCMRNGNGVLDVKWERRASTIHVSWTESCFDDPLDVTNVKKGFGTRLLRQSAESELNGTLHTELTAHGMHVEIDFPYGLTRS